MKWITGTAEAVLGIPFIGGLFILSTGWTPLFVMLVLHIVTLALSVQENTQKYGSVSGIIASALGWIPFLGMLLHIVTAILLLFDASKSQKQLKKA